MGFVRGLFSDTSSEFDQFSDDEDDEEAQRKSATRATPRSEMQARITTYFLDPCLGTNLAINGIQDQAKPREIRAPSMRKLGGIAWNSKKMKTKKKRSETGGGARGLAVWYALWHNLTIELTNHICLGFRFGRIGD